MKNKEVAQVKCVRIDTGHTVWMPEHLTKDLRFLESAGLRVVAPQKFEANFSKEEKQEEPSQVLSKDLKPVTKAKKELKKLESKEEIEAFIEGEERPSIIEEANSLIENL